MKKCSMLLLAALVVPLAQSASATSSTTDPSWFSDKVKMSACSDNKCAVSASVAPRSDSDQIIPSFASKEAVLSGYGLREPVFQPSTLYRSASDRKWASLHGEKPWGFQHVVGVYH